MMNKNLLTDNELNLLLQRARSGASSGRTSLQKIEPYDFQGCGRFTSAQLTQLSEAHANFAGTLGKSFTRLLDADCKITRTGAAQMTYGDFLKLVREGVVFGALNTYSPDAETFLFADPATIFPMIDRMLGGEGNAQEPSLPVRRTLTGVEEEIFRPVVELFAAELKKVWAQHVESSPRYEYLGRANGAFPSERNIVALPFEVQFGEIRGAWILILPPLLASALIRKCEQQSPPSEIVASEGTDRRLRERLLDSRFRLELALPPTSISVRSLARLKEGQVVVLKQRASDPIDVTVEGVHLFQAAAVSCGEYRGAQIKQVLPAAKSGEKEKR